MTVRVVICDDSQFMRELLSDALSRQDGLMVAGVAADPYEARELIKAVNPDVVTLDIDMPRMDGLTFLDRIMKLRPTPVVMVSSHTQRGADITLQALERGAVDAVAKPRNLSGDRFEAFARDLGARVRNAARAQVTVMSGPRSSTGGGRRRSGRTGAKQYGPFSPNALLAFGSSTGGVEALNGVLTVMPENAPPIVIAQHMPKTYTAQFAQRLNERCAITVKEAEDGLALTPGLAVVAPGDRHLEVVRDGKEAMYRCRLHSGDKASGHRPSVDVLMKSAASAAGRDGVGVILTGMGHDGAKGLMAMRHAGAATFAQSEQSALVYGMPKAAVNIGAVESQGDITELVAWSLEAASASRPQTDRRNSGDGHAQSA